MSVGVVGGRGDEVGSGVLVPIGVIDCVGRGMAVAAGVLVGVLVAVSLITSVAVRVSVGVSVAVSVTVGVFVLRVGRGV